MLFCPTCGNILLLEKGFGSLRYFCKTCPYVFSVTQPIKRIETFEDKKVVDLVYSEKEEWENRPTTEAICPKCGHNKAFFIEVQIRSADEPTTIIYKCANQSCGYGFREG